MTSSSGAVGRARLPNDIRIGVTGHRRYDNAQHVAGAVTAVLDRLLEKVSVATVITSLAEGADRLVTELVLLRGGNAAVILPMAAADYESDFASDESRAQFAALLSVASAISIVGSHCPTDDSERESAYEKAGRAVVDASDVVVAIWDGTPAKGRAGTAEIIRYAIDCGVPVEIVLVDRT